MTFLSRLLLALALAVVLLASSHGVALAQAPAPDPAAPVAPPADPSFDKAWPTYSFPVKHEINRGPGWYVALWKVFLLFFTFLVWVRTTDWVSRDCSKLGMNYDQWNSLVFLPFVLIFLASLFIPIFMLGYPLVLIATIAPLGVYIRKRNSMVAESEKVLTKEHLRYLASNWGSLLGAKIDAEKKLEHEKGAPVNLSALGAESEQKNQANLIEARQSPAYLTLKDIIADAIGKRAEKVLMDYTAENVGMKYMIDGVWLDLPPREREKLDPMLAVMKKISNLNIADRKTKQEGAFQAEFQGVKYMCPFVSQGTQTGERAIFTLAGKAQKFGSLEELGMREKMKDQLKQLLLSPHGIIVFCAMPQGGLSQTMALCLKSTDRLMRDFVAIGDKAKHEPDVENVELTGLDAGVSPTTVLRKIILKQPDVLVIRELNDGETLKVLAEQCTDDHPKLSLTSIRAKEAVEAIVRIAQLKLPPSEYAPHLVCVLNTRLIRKLCDKCKEAFEPSAEFLAKLGIPAGRIQTLYRERQPLPPDSKEKRPPCQQCNEIGYFGRTALFELLVVQDNEKLVDAIVKQAPLETLKKVAKATGHRSLQDEGIALLALGITSLAELQRVLKQ